MCSKGPSLQHFVIVQIVQLLCRTVKLGWFDHETHRTIVDDTKRAFLDKGTPAHYLLGLRVLNTLVQEMNLATPGRTVTQQRKTAINFRDNCLFKVFQLSLVALREMLQMGADSRLKEQVSGEKGLQGRGRAASREDMMVARIMAQPVLAKLGLEEGAWDRKGRGGRRKIACKVGSGG